MVDVLVGENKIIKCASCHKDIKESEGVKKLRGAVIVCKDCSDKEKDTKKEGETCEFC